MKDNCSEEKVILRKHQSDLVSAVLTQFQKGNRFALAVAAVASGKSYAAATIAKQFKRVVVLQPSIELMKQNHKSFAKVGIANEMINGNVKGDWNADVILTTANTLSTHLDCLAEPDLLIIDELHLQHWGKMRKTIMEHWKNCKVFGMTATPHYYVQEIRYKNGKMYSVTVCRAIADGYFGPAVFELNREQLKELGYGADIEIKKVNIFKARDFHFQNPVIYEAIIKAHTEQVKELLRSLKNGIIYCDSIAHAQYLANNIQGIQTVFGSTSAKTRNEVVADFVDGRVQFLATVGCLKIGFDKPDLENIIILSNVNNPSNAEQQIGRLNRGSGKKTCYYNSVLNTAEPKIGSEKWIEIKQY